mmetsp:Transcript_66015/g.123106  ORF Transcript_66015/g.123106 Transcript_66015/m.123106 type:complete len:443 (+) Transcript_66015:68-1396(+)
MAKSAELCGLILKNTFLECDVAPEASAMRRAQSEPQKTRASRSVIERRPLGTTPEPLTLDTDSCDDFNLMQDTIEPSGFWPSTPEGHFLPCYMCLPEDRSGEETPSTVSELNMRSVPSWSAGTSGTEDEPSSEEGFRPVLFQQRTHQQQQRDHSPVMCLSTMPPPMPVTAQGAAFIPPALPSAPVAHPQTEQKVAKQPTPIVRVAPPSATQLEAATNRTLAKAVAIAHVQELLQTSENTVRFKFPPGVKVLQWTYFQEPDAGDMSHRAMMSFFRNGVPQHVYGDWQPCKKTARQSAAEVALSILRGTPAELEADSAAATLVDLAHLEPSSKAIKLGVTMGSLQKFDNFLVRNNSTATWECEYDQASNSWTALARAVVFGVEHTFVGAPTACPNEAKAGCATRALWFLGSRVCRGMYVVDRRKWLAGNCEVPPAPLQWSASRC